ncbi:MAG: hypothetical protein ACLQPD_04585 [Desulfomonilaceae bacterium]
MEGDFVGQKTSLYDRFCDMLAQLSVDEQELVCTLTSDFFRCRPYTPPYLQLTWALLSSINPTRVSNAKAVFLIPITSPEDSERRKTKSGPTLTYCAWNDVMPSHPRYERKILSGCVRAIDSLTPLYETQNQRQDSLLIFMDDFVGSGETAARVLTEYAQRCRSATDSLVLAPLVAQRMGISHVRRKCDALSLDVEIVVGLERGRGISDSDRFPDIDHALEIMEGIEKKLKVRSKFWRGYREAQALVQIMRTPNCTFPIYWCTWAADGTRWPAPFWRPHG